MKDFKDLVSTYGANALNSLTKYPSIETYHEIDTGILHENLTFDENFAGEECYITEKVDGTNGRILIYKGDYIIGSREELLYHKGDMFYNPNLGIVDVMRPMAEKLSALMASDSETMHVFYGEVYGGNVGQGAKQYTNHKTFSLRFFDINSFDISSEELKNLISLPLDKISSWREHGGQSFLAVSKFLEMLHSLGVDDNNIVPYIKKCPGDEIPTVRKDAYEWLLQFEKSNATIDEDYAFVNGRGRAEGVVVRNESRKLIRKLRFEDYEKTMKRLKSL